MSYSTHMYGVDLEQLRRVIRDHDLSVLEAARNSGRSKLDRKFDDDEPTVGEALETIIRGGEKNEEWGHQYGYALEVLCRTLGEWLPDDDMIGALEPLELESPLEVPRIPIKIPASRDFPYIAYLAADEVKHESERLASLDLAFPDDEEIEEARKAYANCVNAAAAKKRAIVTFYS